MTRLTSCPDPESVATRASEHILRALAAAREARGVAHLALSGGTTPARTYELLARAHDRLETVEVWFADERCVPPEDSESNYRLARETLLEAGQIPDERVHRMEGERGPGDGARSYAELLRARVPGDGDRAAGQAGGGTAEQAGGGTTGQAGGDDGGTLTVPVLDVIVLGIGPDGHVASLFPGAPTLDAPGEVVCLGVSDSPKPPPERISLSLSVLRAARECVLLASGAGKADAIAAALGEPTRHVPASLLRRERLTVIVDDAAAPAGPAT